MTYVMNASVGESHRTLAWVDNNIKRVGAFIVEAFATKNSTVATSETVEELIDAQLGHIDHLLIDYDMGGKSDASKFAQLIETLDVDRAYLCTGYAHLDVVERMRNTMSKQLGREIGLIRKEHLPVVDEDDQFGDVLMFLEDLDQGSFLSDSADHDLEVLTKNQTMPTYDEHKRLSLEERVKVLSLGRELFGSTIDGYFSDGHIWMLIDGVSGKVINCAKTSSDIIPQFKVDKLAEEGKYVPLTYSKGWSLDSIDSICDPRSEMRNYPVLQLKPTDSLGSSIVDHNEEIIHYDDGNSYTLIGYEYFLERGWISALKNPGFREQGDLELFGKEVVIRDVEVRDSFGNNMAREFRAFAVLNWTTNRLALHCVDVCGSGTLYPPTRQIKICSRRKGLIGRNIKEELNTGIATYPGTSKTKFVGLIG